MTSHEDSLAIPEAKHDIEESATQHSKTRLIILFGVLGSALFALWYDYMFARPAVEQAYSHIMRVNREINGKANFTRMTSVDVQDILGRTPDNTFNDNSYTIEVYRWRAGMPIEFRGLFDDESPSVALKTHDYYAVYRRDGLELAFVTHFKFRYDPNVLSSKITIRSSDDEFFVPDMPDMELYSEHYSNASGQSPVVQSESSESLPDEPHDQVQKPLNRETTDGRAIEISTEGN